MSADSEVEFRKNLILASASFQTKPPTDFIRASCARVLRHALMAAGLWHTNSEDKANSAFHGEYEAFPELHQWYQTLIEQIQEPESMRLLEGGGDFTTLAAASFTACWLTPRGRAIAEKLIADHPGWKAKLTR
jgi:hypothetical protein